MGKESFSGFITRHAQSAKKPESADQFYKSLTPEGVEQAKERTQDILKLIEEAPEGAVLFIGGGSDQLRTQETGEIYGDEINQQVNYELKDRPNIQVITRDFIEWAAGADQAKPEEKQKNLELILQRIEEMIRENPDKKFVVDYPMRLWGFSPTYQGRDAAGQPSGEPRWRGTNLELFNAIVKEKGSENVSETYIAGGGKYITQDGKELSGHKPIEIAQQYFAGLQKLAEFAKEHTDRPLILGGVGHYPDTDCLATWLALGCPENISDQEFLQRFLEISQGQGSAKETEMFSFEVEPDEVKVNYREQEFTTKLK